MWVSRTESIGGVSVTYSAETIEELVALARAFEARAASDDGWIAHAGDECPVSEDTLIEAVDAQGEYYEKTRAEHFDWSSNIDNSTIVKYRVVN